MFDSESRNSCFYPLNTLPSILKLADSNIADCYLYTSCDQWSQNKRLPLNTALWGLHLCTAID